MKDYIALYAAAESLEASADTSQKRYYQDFVKRYKDKLNKLFYTEFKENMEVYYRDEKQTLSPVLLNAPSREMAVSKITSFLLEDHFNTTRPNYPKFTALRQPLTFDRRATSIPTSSKPSRRLPVPISHSLMVKPFCMDSVCSMREDFLP